MIKVDQFMRIKELRSEGHSIRRIAETTGHSRNTVRKLLRGEHDLGADKGSGVVSDEVDGSKQ